jgi:ubiquinol-cytochrome c reductase cytochrome c subunit
MSRWWRRAGVAAGLTGLVAAELLMVGSGLGTGYASGGSADPAPSAGQVAKGRSLYLAGCSSCHGFQARGVRGVAPSLRGVGAQAADFYLTTGRMPLASPDQEPTRKKSAYSIAQIAALDAYIGSFGGPAAPHVSTAGRSLSSGQQLFADNCSGCHQAAGRGGIVTGAFVPSLANATAAQIVEAARVGPYLMPRFGPRELSDRQLASIARYILYLRSPPSRGGWSIGNIGPVPEGMVTWLLALPALLLLTRLIGGRSERWASRLLPAAPIWRASRSDPRLGP